MREGGEGQTNQLYFEKSNERLSEGARMFTIPKQAIFPRGQVLLPISHRRCKNLSLSSLCCKENHRCRAIRPGRIWIERVSFEVPRVYTERTAFLLRKTQSFVTFPRTSVDCIWLYDL